MPHHAEQDGFRDDCPLYRNLAIKRVDPSAVNTGRLDPMTACAEVDQGSSDRTVAGAVGTALRLVQAGHQHGHPEHASLVCLVVGRRASGAA